MGALGIFSVALLAAACWTVKRRRVRGQLWHLQILLIEQIAVEAEPAMHLEETHLDETSQVGLPIGAVLEVSTLLTQEEHPGVGKDPC